MDITLISKFFVDCFNKIGNCLNTVKISNGNGVEIGLFSFFIVLIIFALAVGLLWKGVKK